MITSPYYTQQGHGPYELIDIGSLELEDGGVIDDCHLAVACHGRLNAAKDNAILVPTWYSGTSKIMGEVYIGPGRALDPDRYFIVVVNQIGNGLSTSPHHQADPTRFPRVRIGDDVRAQHSLLLQHFGITQLALVVGGSMGAQQTYEWAVRYPEMVRRVAPIAGTAQNTEHDVMFAETLCEALTTDPAFADGRYAASHEVAAGLKRHAKLWTVMGWSTEFFQQGRHRALGFADMPAFVDQFMTGYFAPMDPNDLLAMAWKWQRGDVARHTGGDLAAALGRIRARTFVMPISHDMFFPPADAERECRLVPGAEFRPIESIDGHLALFGTDPAAMAQIDRHLKELLANPA
ncbi:alpha/beta fold hydrolase [Methylibium petroleiphilum]|uniref:Homoserine O-acetyltransferase n=1 Tax=Methylibium petroleiphilum (strain ATCC BAA-1232 / LMG 22953 / PM1) TaxID=420662 RepID=A2SP86_METPP|nr:alpha/beta fold hydrolase [Methylibium petroleiphilum]ABM97375.1 homoserine O-acetyltransferase [Methylibium petroleiphilum PM1]